MLSIVIPTLNAEATLAATLHAVHAAAPPVLEVLVVDGGSTDQTRRVAADHGAVFVSSEPGRGRQLAMGAERAAGPWLLFLHADTVLPTEWADAVSRFITNDANQGRAAYFRLSFDDASGAARRVAGLANWRGEVWGLPYGDQGLLIHRDFYQEVGGFRADQALMEDVDIVRRIGPMRLKRLPYAVVTSGERYRRDGWWLRPARNLACLTLYMLGAPKAWVERLYR
ncbi:MAG: TIGR04283 family arsenosugar biosynthesis glycosyltransferase [Alphaproteobacteria bacterium]|nr:TIGR04283 family arsenosugar biosynthesis glycosyltransferase [Alphaproteobacteria bacterium]MBF0249362.1 TIGR04283 family arsenosugar biosynthesis glycosyltransferase [Alphaproteobacteria bacterium]